MLCFQEIESEGSIEKYFFFLEIHLLGNNKSTVWLSLLLYSLVSWTPNLWSIYGHEVWLEEAILTALAFPSAFYNSRKNKVLPFFLKNKSLEHILLTSFFFWALKVKYLPPLLPPFPGMLLQGPLFNTQSNHYHTLVSPTLLVFRASISTLSRSGTPFIMQRQHFYYGEG